MVYFARYLVVGGLAYLLHIALLEALLVAGLPSATAASAIGFVAACIFNFTLQRTIVFRSSRGWRDAGWRYATVTLVMLGANTAIFFALNETLGLAPVAAQTITTGGVFLLNFFCNRRFTFAATPGS